VKVGETVQGRLRSVSRGSGRIRHGPRRDAPQHDPVDLEVMLEEVNPHRLMIRIGAHGLEFDELPVDPIVALASDFPIHAPDNHRSGVGMAHLSDGNEVSLPSDFVHVRLFHHEVIVRPHRETLHEDSRDMVADPTLVKERLLVPNVPAHLDDWYFVEVDDPDSPAYARHYLDSSTQGQPANQTVRSRCRLETQHLCELSATGRNPVLLPKPTYGGQRIALTRREAPVLRCTDRSCPGPFGTLLHGIFPSYLEFWTLVYSLHPPFHPPSYPPITLLLPSLSSVNGGFPYFLLESLLARVGPVRIREKVDRYNQLI